MTIYKLQFNLSDKKFHTSIFTDDKTPDNLVIEESPFNRLKTDYETMHEFITRLILYSIEIKPSIKKRLIKLIKKTDITEKYFIAGVDTIEEKPHETLEFDEDG